MIHPTSSFSVMSFSTLVSTCFMAGMSQNSSTAFVICMSRLVLFAISSSSAFRSTTLPLSTVSVMCVAYFISLSACVIITLPSMIHGSSFVWLCPPIIMSASGISLASLTSSSTPMCVRSMNTSQTFLSHAYLRAVSLYGANDMLRTLAGEVSGCRLMESLCVSPRMAMLVPPRSVSVNGSICRRMESGAMMLAQRYLNHELFIVSRSLSMPPSNSWFPNAV